jgi:hypothetical protein
VRSGLPCFATIVVLGMGMAAFGSNPEAQSGDLKIEGSSLPHAANEAVSMRVLWTVSHFKVGEKAVWGEKESRTLLFKALDIGATTITFDGQTCRNVIFERELVNVEEYLHRVHRTTPLALGIEGAVEVIKTNCRLPGFSEYMRLRDRTLIIHINGVFFYFAPAVTY